MPPQSRFGLVEVWQLPFAFETRPEGKGTRYRIHDAADNAICSTFSPDGAADLVAMLNAGLSALSEKLAPESRWVPTIDRQPDVDGRLWAILTTRMDDGRHTGYIPLYEYYYFTNGWATDDTVTHWLDCPLHPFPSATK